MSTIEDIKKLIATPKVVFGTKEITTHMRHGEMARIFVSSNCPASVRSDLARFTAIHPVELVEVGVPGDELGTICKKPYAVSLLGQLK